MSTLELYVDRRGGVRCLYTEAIDLSVLGELSVRRASHVEPDGRGGGGGGGWSADLAPSGGPVLGPYPLRSQALDAESAWLVRHVLPPSLVPSHHKRKERKGFMGRFIGALLILWLVLSFVGCLDMHRSVDAATERSP